MILEDETFDIPPFRDSCQKMVKNFITLPLFSFPSSSIPNLGSIPQRCNFALNTFLMKLGNFYVHEFIMKSCTEEGYHRRKERRRRN